MSKTAESLTHPAYGQLRAVTDTASVLLADNPGLLTLDGTNTWVLRGPLSDELVVVDPGPDDDEHLARVAALGRIALVLISHRHGDHTSGIDKLVALTGAPVRAADPQFLRRDGETLTDGEVIDVAGLTITVLATPGHTADSLSFVLDDAVLTADTVLGCGTTVIDKEDGSLADYLESLHRLRGLGRRTVLPGHGPDLLDLEAIASGYLLHRHERLEQIRARCGISVTTPRSARSSNTSTSTLTKSFGMRPNGRCRHNWTICGLGSASSRTIAQNPSFACDSVSAGREEASSLGCPRGARLPRSAGQSFGVRDQHTLALKADPAAVSEISQCLVHRLA